MMNSKSLHVSNQTNISTQKIESHITQKYRRGFLLTEQDIRKLIRFSLASLKTRDSLSLGDINLSVVTDLLDGTRIETSNIEEIFDIDNIAKKQIRGIAINLGNTVTNDVIHIIYQDPNIYSLDGTSTQISVISPDKDWATITFREIEHRVKKTHNFSVQTLVESKWFFYASLGISFLLVTIINTNFSPSYTAVDVLEKAYMDNEVNNAIEALIILEKAKQSTYGMSILLAIGVAYMLPILLFSAITTIVPKLYPSYIFYWGDYVEYHTKIQRIISFIFGGILLALILGVAGNYLYALLT